jgi:hypothetical protein
LSPAQAADRGQKGGITALRKQAELLALKIVALADDLFTRRPWRRLKRMVGDSNRKAQARLERIAESGRALRERQAQRDAAEAEPEALTSKRRATARDRRVRARLLDRGPWPYVGMGVALGVPLLATEAVLVPRWHLGGDEGLFWSAAFMSIGGLVFVAVRWIIGLGIVGRERARLQALGFTVDGWFEVLRSEGLANGRQHIQLQFHGPVPTETALQSMMSRVGAEPDGGAGRFKSPFLVARRAPHAPPNPAPYVNFQARLLDRVLRPLHAEFPLARVILYTETADADES